MQADSLSADTTGAPGVTEAASGIVAKLIGWFEAFILLLPNLVLAVLIVVAGAFLARIVRRVVTSVLERTTGHAPQE